MTHTWAVEAIALASCSVCQCRAGAVRCVDSRNYQYKIAFEAQTLL